MRNFWFLEICILVKNAGEILFAVWHTDHSAILKGSMLEVDAWPTNSAETNREAPTGAVITFTSWIRLPDDFPRLVSPSSGLSDKTNSSLGGEKQENMDAVQRFLVLSTCTIIPLAISLAWLLYAVLHCVAKSRHILCIQAAWNLRCCFNLMACHLKQLFWSNCIALL